MNVTFSTYAEQTDDLLANYLLACSIRDFAGSFSEIPLRIYVSSDLEPKNELKRFAGLNVMFSTYPAARKDTPYAFKSAAASACEADVKTGEVIWLDRHMLVLGPCVNLLLDPPEQFAYRPPHLQLLGASVDEPVSPLWAAAYRIAGIGESDLFPVITEVDRKKIWAYFSAGHFSFRAEAGVMREWDSLYNRLLVDPEMAPFLDKTITEYAEFIRVFLHQIALTLTVLKKLNRDALKPLPNLYGYPTHLHNDIEKQYQANQMDQIHTAFYSCRENVVPDMPVSERLATWLQEKVNSYHSF